MAEIMFYHLEHKPWEQVLPAQLSKALERGWRCVVQIGKEDRVEEVSELLWKSEAEAFLAHGTRADGMAHMQPIWLTAETDNLHAYEPELPRSDPVPDFLDRGAVRLHREQQSQQGALDHPHHPVALPRYHPLFPHGQNADGVIIFGH